MNPKKDIRTAPAIFYDTDIIYRADTCEPLKTAARNHELVLNGFGRNCYPGTALPVRMLPELCLACVWDAKTNQNWGLETHRNEGLEIGYLTRGKLDFVVNESVYPLTSGHLTLTRPWQPHKVGNPSITASRMHWLILDVGVRRPNETWKWPDWLIFSPQDLSRFTEMLRYNEYPVWQGNAKVEECFENIALLTEEQEPERVHTRLKFYINSLLIELYELLQKKNIELDAHLASTRRSVEMFLAALPKHLNYPWTLNEMASHCNLGRSRFAHHCKLITNMTPAEYLNHCRIEMAQRIMKNYPDRTITDIAMHCGFDSSQYFATVFKRHTGKTPSSFRQK